MAYSPDGQYLASAGGSNPFWVTQSPQSIRPGEVLVWAAATGGRSRPPLRHPHLVSGVAFRLDGKQFVSAGEDGTARLFDAATGVAVRALRAPAALRGVCFRLDGRVIAAACSNRTVCFWDAATGEPARPLAVGTELVWVCYSPDQRWLVTCSADPTTWAGAAQVWDADRLTAATASRTLRSLAPLTARSMCSWVTATVGSPAPATSPPARTRPRRRWGTSTATASRISQVLRPSSSPVSVRRCSNRPSFGPPRPADDAESLGLGQDVRRPAGPGHVRAGASRRPGGHHGGNEGFRPDPVPFRKIVSGPVPGPRLGRVRRRPGAPADPLPLNPGAVS